MLDANDRIGRLSETIMADAEKSAADIIKNAEETALQITSEAHQLFAGDEQRQINEDRAKTEGLYAKEMSSRDFAAKKEILAYRTELVNKLFYSIEEKISAYCEKEDYKELLIKLVEKADKEQPVTDTSVIYLSQRDMKYSDMIEKRFKAKVKKDKNISLGGVLVYYPEKNLFADNTLDTSLEKQRSLFVNKKELAL